MIDCINIKLAAAHQVTFAEAVPLRNCLGVLQVSACLRQRSIGNIQCDVLDLCEFHDLFDRDFNETMERLSVKFLEPRPDLVGLSTMADNLPIAVEICERIKKKDPDITTVLGGPGISFCAIEVLRVFPWVDVVVRGEADNAFPDYIEALSRGIKNPDVKGLVYRSGDSITDNGWPSPVDNLDDLPFPAFEFCGDYATGSKHPWASSISLEPGRGCTFNCSFCSTSSFFKRKHRLKSVPRFIDEILYAREQFGDRKIIFNHDIFVYHHEYISELCIEIERRVPGLSWRCHARFDTIDDDILEKMRRAGCMEIFLGIETATARMQKAINKNLDLTRFEKTLEKLRELDYRFCLSFIVGFPEEKSADIEAIFAMALRARHRCGDNAIIRIHLLIPILGSEVYKKWRDLLEFDDYGSVGTSNIPQGWTKSRGIIKKHPGIFPLFHHIPIGESKRVRTNKFELLGMAINSLMKYSTQLAYTGLGKQLPAAFVQHVDKIELPPPASFKDIDYPILTQSLRRLILELLEPDPVLAQKYDAVAQFEIALNKVSRQKSSRYSQMIDTYYDPAELVKELRTGTFDTRGLQQDKKLRFMVLWDETVGDVKCAQIPSGFPGFFSPGPTGTPLEND